jgi:hypothetical protein
MIKNYLRCGKRDDNFLRYSLIAMRYSLTADSFCKRALPSLGNPVYSCSQP